MRFEAHQNVFSEPTPNRVRQFGKADNNRGLPAQNSDTVLVDENGKALVDENGNALKV
jgi:hypothetical protein